MVTFSFIQYGENLGTRPLGQRVRESLLPMIEQNDLVVLDFTGVNVVSNSFADECIAKLLLHMTLAELKSRQLSGLFLSKLILWNLYPSRLSWIAAPVLNITLTVRAKIWNAFTVWASICSCLINVTAF